MGYRGHRAAPGPPRIGPRSLRLYTGSRGSLEVMPGVTGGMLPPHHPLPVQGQALGVWSTRGQLVNIANGRPPI